jgi:enterochelin esterase family protein
MHQAATEGPGGTATDDLNRVVVPRRVMSTAITRLLAEFALAAPDRRTRSVDAFWADVGRVGTPLIELVDDEPQHRDVTFVWRDRAATAVLVSFSGLPRSAPETGQLSRVDGTDIWYATFRLRSDHRSSYRFIVSGPDTVADDRNLSRNRDVDPRRMKLSGQPDPFNSCRLPGRWGQPESSVFALPDAPADPWLSPFGRSSHSERPSEHRPADRSVVRHRVESERLGCERDVWVYRPPAAEQGTDPAVLVLCDGDRWFGELQFQRVLDAAIDAGIVPPVIVLAPDAVDLDTRWQELSAHDPFVDFLADELLGNGLPAEASGRWSVTVDPARTVIAGQSLGGLTALYAALTRPDRFGAVLAQSASLWWKPGLPTGRPRAGDPRHCWLADRFAAADRLPAAVHLQAGLLEGDPVGGAPSSMVLRARRLRNVLQARGVQVSSYEFAGGHDYACWRSTLIDGLARVLR